MKVLRIFLCVVAMTMFFAQGAFAGEMMGEMTMGASVSANIELNTDLKTSTEENAAADGGDLDQTELSQDGRAEVTIEGKGELDTGFYVAGKGVFEIGDDGSFYGSDMYMEVGSTSWFMQAGRLEAESLFGKGQDIYIVSAPGAPGRYETNFGRGRENLGFVFALTPSDALKAEVDVLYDENGDNNIIGARPFVKFSAGALTVKGGVDYYLEIPKDPDAEDEITKLGFGGNGEFGLGALTLGASAAVATVGGKDTAGDDLDDEQTVSLAGYLKMAVGAGTFGAYAGTTMLTFDKADTEKTAIETYVSYNMPLPVEGAAIKFGVSYATAKLEKQAAAPDQDNSAFGGRVRLYYEY